MNNQISSIISNLSSAPLLAIDQLGRQLGHSLIIAPHPDDEALGCGGMISYLRSQNVPVSVVFMTSGGASHLNSLKYPPKLLAEVREAEALKSCEILGVHADHVFFYRYPDGVLSSYEDEKVKEIAQQISLLMEKQEIKTIFYPWRRDVHPDHKMCNTIGFSAVNQNKSSVQIVEYPVWLWNISEENDWPEEEEISVFRLNVTEVLEQKKAAIFAHKSQTSEFIDDDPSGFRLTEDLLAPFLGDYEFYFFTKDKMESLDQQFFDTLYSDNADPWNFKHSDYELAKYQKTNEILGDSHFKNGLEVGCSIGIQTRFFAKHCDTLLAIDISKDALAEAEKNNNDLENVTFQVKDIVQDFPDGQYDFITLCELGYYFDPHTLQEIFQKVSEHLNTDGQFLMVHWTSYVREFPLNGNQVNQIFRKFNTIENKFSCLTSYIHDNYELYIWRKN
ncbi:bifunctional PIG-L family deacetylase/class I SAM-dependent methyltransferase [Gelidibacter gilvus]|uniref:Methyltransferase domain-containing protein n=1 Tax=Gelidibacter gilvus TaxID=59602 RepID=A0A4Q0XEN2_9FLAO|nr:bifunctional PIG-L family deacetylase/class I SAM-dependent methyltransferase [Gelidibacter gilvus]RXJ44365.1 methyltransferase domain-containing protein [Gelidibacter gilvus]